MPSSRFYSAPVPQMPPGVVEIMEGLAKDVLKNNPVNIYEFCSQHIKKLIEIRDGKETKKELTLDEKISKVLVKMRKRAEQRQSKYNSEIEMLLVNKLETNRDKTEVHDDQMQYGRGDKTGDVLPKNSDNEVQNILSAQPHGPTLNKNDLVVSLSPDKYEDSLKELDTLTENRRKLSLASSEDKSLNGDENKENFENSNCTSQETDISVQDPGSAEKNEETIQELDVQKQKEKKGSGFLLLTDGDNNLTLDKKEGDRFTENVDSIETQNGSIPTHDSVNVLVTHVSSETLGYIKDTDVQEEKGSGLLLFNESDKSLSQEKKESDGVTEKLDSIDSQNGSVPLNGSENVSDIHVCLDTHNDIKETDVQETKTELSLSTVGLLRSVEIPNNTNSTDNFEYKNENILNISNVAEGEIEEKDIIKNDFDKKDVVSAELVNVKNKEMQCITPVEESSIEICNKKETTDKNSDFDEIINTETALDMSEINSTLAKTENLEMNILTPMESTETRVILDNAEQIHSNETNLDTETEIQNGFDSSMDLEKAAVTIQKVFRAFLFKTKTLSVDDVTNVDVNLFIGNTDNEGQENIMGDKINKSIGLCRMDTVLQTVNEEKSLSLSTEDSSTLSSAATIIQAHVRGFLARNKMHFDKTTSNSSAIDSDIQCSTSQDGESIRKNKTVLNIHIVPEEDNFLSREESILTSADLSLDASPPSSTNLHPLGYNKNERRKQLKREDAVQSISPPTNNSGKQSEDIDSVKEILCDDRKGNTKTEQNHEIGSLIKNNDKSERKNSETDSQKSYSNENINEMSLIASDEMDVITPLNNEAVNTITTSNASKLIHTGEFHDNVLPTLVSRSNTSVVSEFQNVFVYFLLWNTSS